MSYKNHCCLLKRGCIAFRYFSTIRNLTDKKQTKKEEKNQEDQGQQHSYGSINVYITYRGKYSCLYFCDMKIFLTIKNMMMKNSSNIHRVSKKWMSKFKSF